MSIPRIGNGTTQACAACKYQRRKCAPDCILAPYFPHDRQRQFLNAHKLFGVSNITKIIRNLDPLEKEAAMHTIIFQSDARANDPVGGCYGIIRELQRQIEYCKAELDMVLHQLAICRAQAHQIQIQETNDDIVNADLLNSYNNPIHHNYHYHHLQAPQQEEEYNTQNNNHDQLQEEDVNAWVVQDSMFHVRQQQQQQHQPFVNECDDDDVKPAVLERSSERHEKKFESEELVERRFVPSTQLVISS